MLTTPARSLSDLGHPNPYHRLRQQWRQQRSNSYCRISQAGNRGGAIDSLPQARNDSTIRGGTSQLGLERVHVDDKFHLLGFVDLVRSLDRMSELSQCLTQRLKASIDLIAVTERDDVLARCFDSDSFEPVPREHAWSSHSVNPCGGNDVIVCG